MANGASLLNSHRKSVGGYWGTRNQKGSCWAERQGKESPGKMKYFLFKYLRQLTFIPLSSSKSKIPWDFFACQRNWSQGFSIENQAAHRLCLDYVISFDSPIGRVWGRKITHLSPTHKILRLSTTSDALLILQSLRVLCSVCHTLPSMLFYPLDGGEHKSFLATQGDIILMASIWGLTHPDFHGQYYFSQTWEASETELLFDLFSNGAPQPKNSMAEVSYC